MRARACARVRACVCTCANGPDHHIEVCYISISIQFADFTIQLMVISNIKQAACAL